LGTPIETCTEIAQELAEDSAGRESAYWELIEQSFETLDQAANSENQPKLVRGQVTKSATQPSDLAILETIAITFQNNLLKSIMVGFDPAFSKIFLKQNLRRTATPSGAEKAERRPAPTFERLTDLELPVAVVLGRTKLRVRDALKLTAGSLIELDHRVGEPVEIVVHNVVVARGEVVSVKGNYAVQILDVNTPGQRYALKASATSRSSLAQLQSALSNDAEVLSPSSVQ
jgi:flagellar motor switch protein FliN